MAHEVVFAPEARSDLLDIYDYIAARSAPARALGFTERLVSYCTSLAVFPERGTQRDDLRPGLWIIGYHRRVTIAFHVTSDT